ncbi:putative holin [Pseudomonas sp. NBRC 111135]|uniref:putative holin n=1 Tax=Pseudomonas sp. NBRC 111135 TaxID=1661050 RepID=UPI00055F9CAF|nr:putative holin [Pseudomonas sp. NBRC 111135]
MGEPSSGAAVGTAVAGIGVASLFPGVDLNAVIGAFAGALFFVLYARDLTTKARVGYLLVSWVGGYYVAAEAVGRAWTEYSGLPALVAGACIVTALIGVLEWMVGGKAPTWLRTVLGFFTGGRKDGS